MYFGKKAKEDGGDDEMKKEFQNFSDVLNVLLENRSPDRIMIKEIKHNRVREISAQELAEDIDDYAAKMSDLCLTKAHVGIIGTNSYQWLVTFLAVLSVGAVPVLISPNQLIEEIIEDILYTDTQAVLYDSYVEKNFYVKKIKQIVPVVPFFRKEEKRRTGKRLAVPNQRKKNEIACILFTSGTDGRKKAVVHTFQSMLAGFWNNIMKFPFKSQLALLPFYHLSGYNAVLNTWYLGGTICLGENIQHFFRYLSMMQPDYAFLVPSMVKVLAQRLKMAEKQKLIPEWNLKYVNCGGAVFPCDVLDIFSRHNIVLMNSYGSSEGGGIGFLWSMNEERGRHEGSIGKPPEEMEIKISDGELLVKSASVMKGYYNELQISAEVLENGWYHTGDLCYQDEEGYLFLYGRKHNRIVLSNGENICPEELESKLNKLSHVEESMVKEENDFLVATIVINGAKEEVRKEIEQLNRTLPRYKQIVKVYFSRKPFQKNAMGKIIRK